METAGKRRRDGARKSRFPFLAGGVAGIVEISITYPFEFVKTSVQLGMDRSPLHALSRNFKAGGIRLLYSGFPSWLLFAFPRSALRFTVFQKTNSALHGVSKETGLELAPTILNASAGLVAGAVEGVLCLTPMQNLSVRMTHDANLSLQQQRFRGFFSGALQICRDIGPTGLLRGAEMITIKNSTNNVIRFAGFHALSEILRNTRDEGELRFVENLLCGAVAGGVSAVVTHPTDVVKANLMRLDSGKFASTWSCILHIWKSHGLKGFYNGLSPRILRVCLEVGLHFSMFQHISFAIDDTFPA